MTLVWYVDSTGVAKPARVRVGLSDGQKTEVTSPTLREGMQVVIGLPATNESATTAASNPLQPQRGAAGRGPGGGRGGF
jgi:multidrug efflux pump subunit AcrA (membrane-fusion protein)